MPDCTAVVPSGAPQITKYSYSGNTFTVTLKAAKGPRTALKLNYGPSCTELKESIDLPAESTSHTFTNFGVK